MAATFTAISSGLCGVTMETRCTLFTFAPKESLRAVADDLATLCELARVCELVGSTRASVAGAGKTCIGCVVAIVASDTALAVVPSGVLGTVETDVGLRVAHVRVPKAEAAHAVGKLPPVRWVPGVPRSTQLTELALSASPTFTLLNIVHRLKGCGHVEVGGAQYNIVQVHTKQVHHRQQSIGHSDHQPYGREVRQDSP